MAGPWENYASPVPEVQYGPWDKYNNQTRDVLDEESGKIIQGPRSSNADEILYLDSIQNKKKPNGDFWGFQAIRGLSNFAASTPQIAGSEMVRSAEAFEETYNKDFGLKDIANLALPIGPNSGERMASFAKVKEKLGIDTSFDLGMNKSMLEGGNALIAKNKKFLEDYNLTKQEGDGVFFDIGSGTGSIASSIAMTFLTKNPAAASVFFSELQRSSGYIEARESGKTPEDARKISNAMAVAEGALEAVGGSVFLKAAGVNGGIKRVIMRSANEAIQEASQTGAEELITQSTGVRETDVIGALQNIGYSAALGFIISAPINTIVGKIEADAQKAGLSAEQAKVFADNLVANQDEIVAHGSQMLKNEAGNTANDKQAMAETAKIIEKFQKGEPVDGSDMQIKTNPEDRVDASLTELTAEEQSRYGGYVDEKPGIFAAPIETAQNIGKGFDKLTLPISERLREISQPLMFRLRRFEIGTKARIQDAERVFTPFLQKAKSMSKQDKKVLDVAMKNGDIAVVSKLANKYDMTNELQSLRSTLNEIYGRAKEAGIEVDFREDYFPRLIKDPEGLINHLEKKEYWNIIERAIRNKEINNAMTEESYNQLKEYRKKITKEIKNGERRKLTKEESAIISKKYADKKASLPRRPLTTAERAEVANTLLRGFTVADVSLAKAGAFKERSIEEITPELDKFYASSQEALLAYAVTANESIETAKLFGKGNDFSKGENLDNSVGAYVDELVRNGEINSSQAQDVKDVFGARFNAGRISKGWDTFKNGAYLTTMGSNLGSSVTQITDLAITSYKMGLLRTASVASRAVSSNTKVTLEDIGVVRIAQEFESKTLLGKATAAVFEATQLSRVDRFGKRALLEASYEKNLSNAKANNAEFNQKLEFMFGNDAAQVKQDLIDGNFTEDVKFIMANDLLDMQPIAQSEMPEAYLRAGNGKVFYILKSFTLKQISIYRRDGINKITKGFKTGDKKMIAQGAGNIVRLLTLMTIAGVGRDYIWDFLSNQEPDDIDDRVVENMFKAFGLSKYTFDQMNRPYLSETPGGALFGLITPPTKTSDNLWRDWQKLKSKKGLNFEDMRVLRSIPVGGELYWFWFGGGSGDSDNKKSSKPTIKDLQSGKR